MSRVTKRPEAEADLLEIAVYIAQDDLAASDRFIDAVAEKLDFLARHPTMGRLRPELAPNLRSFPIGQYVIFYRPTRNGIDVVRVLSGARDIPALF
ncbi:MAG: type II toxin-antitoxin system RelE/ParE family toxin [Deltaproteobacteria bacterium]|nr:type II toxin-antitoxin system RelE/ParE family toxin [Deltaproteobacteria bacterium]